MTAMRKYLVPGLGAALGGAVAVLLLTPVGGFAWSGARHAVAAGHQSATAKPRRGPRGPRGPRGFRGIRGPQGLQGPGGSTGAQGIQGAQGAKGDTGARGPKGGLELYCARVKAKPFAYPDGPCRAQSYAVDTGGGDNVGWTPSIEIGMDGNPVVSYAAATGGDLKLARCSDPLCSNGDEKLSTVDSADNVGREDSLAIGADGNPVISYEDDTTQELKLVHCNDPACAGNDETPNVVASAGSSNAAHTSVAVGGDGNPTISYYLDGDLEVVHCNDAACAGGDEIVHPVDTTDNVGYESSLALGTDGNPVISYYDTTNGDLDVARCNDPACAAGGDTVTIVDSANNVGLYSSLAIGTDGNPVISYWDATNTNLKVAHCNDSGCTGHNETLSTVDDSGSVGNYTSIVIGPDGNPIVSYSDNAGGHLKVARCNDPACAGHNEALSIADPAPLVAQETSIALGLDGNPIIAHWDGANGDLKVSRPAIP